MCPVISLGKCFVTTFEPILKERGYSRKRQIFHRLVNDQILQRVSIKKYSGNGYTIQWSNIPLCCGDEVEVFMDDWTLHMFAEKGEICEWMYLNDKNGEKEWVVYSNSIVQPYKTEHYEQQMHRVLALCQKQLLPFLDSIHDYRSLLDAMHQLYKRSPHFPDGMPVLHDYVYHLNLYLGEYETAWKSRQALIQNNLMKVRYPPIPPEDYRPLIEKLGPYWRDRMGKMLDNYEKMRAAAEKGDRESIEAYLAENEAFSLASYRQNYFGKQAQHYRTV